MSRLPADDPLELVHAVMHAYRSRQYRVLRDGAHDITHMESKALGFFARHPGATQTDLVAHSGRDKGQTARLVAGLRERGLLAAEPDAADRRSLRLSLTADGEAVQALLAAQARKLSKAAVGGFSKDERDQVAALLRRMLANLDGA
ncbi:MarR family winged helix-turn-helix transcriptional regulator [Derxia gummosa]|uniref:MarR family winged helix-turn-helix transcriptional regulator n=1 Tax=Derxia gummosa DSM 723 TaxID=1121388 RepID=A0A8B6X4J7_9BURK|nr:MarR family winged helix-turn-helix transcriptional regulator [Derxia gummosa]